MKKILFFLIISTIIISCIKTKAKTYEFYEAETIPNIYMTKIDRSTNTWYYQKARFFREVGTDEFAYCIETFNTFVEGSIYNEGNPTNISQNQLDKITKIAHYGYGYPGHSDKTWYAVTQVMIWKELVNNDDVFFTDKLNGNRINTYDGMIDEINNLITSNEVLPSFNNKTINIVKNHDIEIEDTNRVLNNYKPSTGSINNNKLILKGLKENTTITLTRNDNHYNKPVLFFTSLSSQNLVQTGNINIKNAKVTINIQPTSIKIIKIDEDTMSTKPSGEGELKGSIFGIYNLNNNLIEKITIDENGEGIINNIDYGKYYIKEETSGIGYKINNTKTNFEITEKQTDIKLKLSNQIIKKKVIINKTYGNKNYQKPEANIEFNIYDKNNKIIKTIKTNELGKAEIILPYGEYTIKQLTSTEGYEFTNPMKIKVIDEKEETINLKDYQIEVPNTSTKISFIELLLSLLL